MNKVFLPSSCRRHFIISLWTMLCCVLLCVISPAQIKDEGDSTISPVEKKELGLIARRFVKRLSQTHDIAPLVKEFFSDDYEPFLDNAYEDEVSPELFSTLNIKEKRRLLIATYSLMYISSVLFMSDPEAGCVSDTPECIEANRRSLSKIFSEKVVLRMEQLEKNRKKAQNRSEVLRIIADNESLVREARPVLQRSKLEETPKFKAEYSNWTEMTHFNFEVGVSVSDTVIKDEKGRIIIKKGVRIFGVTTPHFISLVLLKKGKNFKIVDLAVSSDQ